MSANLVVAWEFEKDFDAKGWMSLKSSIRFDYDLSGGLLIHNITQHATLVPWALKVQQ